MLALPHTLTKRRFSNLQAFAGPSEDPISRVCDWDMSMPKSALSFVSEPARAAIEQMATTVLARGAPIIALNGRRRGYFLFAAAKASTEVVNQSIVWGRGLTCFSVTPERAMRMGLLLASEYTKSGPIFLRSVEAADCTGTGISASDRAMTLRAAGASDAGIFSLKSPGHVIPVMVDEDSDAVPARALRLLKRLIGEDVPAWTDILDDDGELANADYCQALAESLAMTSLQDD